MSLGELCTRWTVRLALLGYFAGALGSAGKCSSRRQRLARCAWTLGCLCYLAHVACAFGSYHGWSQASAYRHTAERTAAVTGWNWGGGLYFNYAFTAVWLADVLWMWRAPFPADPPRRDWMHVTVQFFMAFMVFNATVVFGQGFARWLGMAGCALLTLRWFSQRPARSQ